LLLAGQVAVGTGDHARRDRKPGDMVDAATPVDVIARPRYVSRGGEKLAAALDAFTIDPTGRICLDVGASTGGFTDVLLQRGAARIYALDVGRGQLAESLRRNARVVSMERTHAGRLDPSHEVPLVLPERVSLTVIDVSFISLTRILRGVQAQLTPEGEIVALVKPQFEAGREAVTKGVVRDPAVRRAAVDKVRAHAEELGFRVAGEIESPLLGPAGNHEFLIHLVGAA
jgi:23S rRNA (cytidine1920-2'-O)/16S rRNA (cytidine1409-2'-O)-methyltransferase